MGNPKQKWTSDEEEALRAGVKKHGTGKWKDIQKDPEFNPFLSARSNIDLKDKWRNMTVSGLGTRKKVNPDSSPAPLSVAQGSTPTPVRRDGPALVQVKCDPDSTPVRRDAPAAVPVRHDTPAAVPVADDSSTGLSDSITAQMYNTMIFEALSTSKDPNGMDTGAISFFIEQRTEVPQNFRRSLTTRLRKLVAQDKLEKVQNCFKSKVKTEPTCGTKAPAPKQDIQPRQLQLLGGRAPASKQKDSQPRQMQIPGYVIPGDTIEESAMSAASKIAEAENKSLLAAESVKDADLISQKLEETEAGLQLARDILELCSEGDVMLME